MRDPEDKREPRNSWAKSWNATVPAAWFTLFTRDALRDHPARFAFLNRTVRDTIAVFHADPFASRSVREIAKHAGAKSASGVHGYVREMEAAGLLAIDGSSSSDAWPRYRANLDSPILLKSLETIEVERRIAFYRHAPALGRRLERAVAGLLDATSWGVSGLYLFGSWARGQQERSSDVDLLLIMRREENQLEEAAGLVEEALKGTFSPSVVTSDPLRLREGLASRVPFFQELWRDRVVLFGESLFWQIVRSIASSAR